jgi:predicted SAM-dependent methyltransferase
MAIKSISLNRKITSYGKVQVAISNIIRSKGLFINRKRIRDLRLLNIGCGEHVYPQFVNLDYFWRPGINICLDITKKGYPLPDNSMEGVYTEHCLEHIPLSAGEKNLKEMYRVLKPGGTVRIVVPDGELYFTLYNKK